MCGTGAADSGWRRLIERDGQSTLVDESVGQPGGCQQQPQRLLDGEVAYQGTYERRRTARVAEAGNLQVGLVGKVLERGVELLLRDIQVIDGYGGLREDREGCGSLRQRQGGQRQGDE